MSASQNVPVIGLIGGVGSGKSAVANWLAARRHVCVIDADAIGHEVLRLPEVKRRIRDHFGEKMFDEDGEVDRRRLGSLVFGPSDDRQSARKQLESIVHPQIRRGISETISREKTSNSVEAVVLDAAVLLEAGWNNVCTVVVFIDSPLEARQERVSQTRGWNEAQLHSRESSQMSLSEKQSQADFTISNDSTLEHAGRRLETLLDQLIAADE